MIELHEQLWVARPQHEVFAYACEFANCQQWDASATESVKLSTGPTGVGTTYRVVCALPLGSLTLHYRVVEWQAPDRVVLEGSCGWFEVRDTITLSQHPAGSTLDYRAEFQFKRGLERFEPRLRPSLERMGKTSIQGLEEALEDHYPAPTLRDAVRRSDRWILPGLWRFTRWGFQNRSAQFQPTSAYLGDKHMLLTGATSGIGLAAARSLAERGAALTLVVRDRQRGEKLIAQLRRETGNARLRLEIADLSLMQDVRDLVSRLLADGRPVDVLINNAGALFNPRQETAEGLEKSLALLLLGPGLLTEGLLPLLRGHDNARVINVVSGGMYTQHLDLGQLRAARAAIPAVSPMPAPSGH